MNLPPNYHTYMLFDETSLKNPKDAIEKAFVYWEKESRRSSNINSGDISKILNKLAPDFKLAPSLKSDYEKTEQQFIQLTKEQSKILDFLQFQTKAAISGAAGTGKTLIALEKVKQLKAQGRKPLFLCYNSLLSEYLNENNKEYGIEIGTFDSIAAKYGIKKNSFEETREFFLEYLLDKDAAFPFTDVIIDEGQDFENDWIEVLDHYNDGCFYIFYDPKQNLYEKELPRFISESPTRLSLTTNCRNTEAIAKTAYEVGGVKNTSVLLSGVSGSMPTIINRENPKEIAKEISKVINKHVVDAKMPLDKIALITLNSWDDSELKLVLDQVKFGWSKTIEKNKAIATTVKKYKGLEADLLFVFDFDWNKLGDKTYKNNFYTACSRAKFSLQIIADDLDSVDTGKVLKDLLGSDRKVTGKRRLLKMLNLNYTK